MKKNLPLLFKMTQSWKENVYLLSPLLTQSSKAVVEGEDDQATVSGQDTAVPGVAGPSVEVISSVQEHQHRKVPRARPAILWNMK